MPTPPTISFGGLASGLDTRGIVDQLMALERRPLVFAEQQAAALRARDSAWGTVVTRLGTLSTALAALRSPEQLASHVRVVSSNPAAVSVTSTGAAEPADLDIEVVSLATGQRTVSVRGLPSADTLVGAGTLTVTGPDGAVLGQVTTDGSTTLQGLARSLTGLGAGVRAEVLRVGDGDHRLLVTSSSTGAASGFTLTSTHEELGGVSTLGAAADAVVRLGTLEVRRGSNTFDDLVAGVKVTLLSASTAPVRVTVARDADVTVKAVQTVVDELNGLLDRLGKLTSFDADTRLAGPLQGDRTARDLPLQLRAQLTAALPGATGRLRHAGDVGVGLTREGRVSFDPQRLREALAADPTAVAGLLGRSLTGPAGIELIHGGPTARSGTFTVQVLAQAAPAASEFAWPPSGGAGPATFTLTPAGASTATEVTVGEGVDAAGAVAAITDALRSSGQSRQLRATLATAGDGSQVVRLVSTTAGSAAGFTVAGYGQEPDRTAVGVDLVADLGAGAVVGRGDTLVATGPAAGLTLRVSAAVGQYEARFSEGVLGQLGRWVQSLDATGGRVKAARTSIDDTLRGLDRQRSTVEARLALREETLRRRFANLESTLGGLQSRGSFVLSGLASLPTRTR